MSPTYGQVRQWSSQGLFAAGEQAATVLEKVARAGDELDAARRSTWDGTTTWTGTASGAAHTQHQRLEQELADLRTELGTARRVFFSTGEAVTGLEHAVTEVHGFATTHQVSISDTGMVTDTATPPDGLPRDLADEYTDERTRRVAETVHRVEQILRTADHIDTTLATAMNQLAPWAGDQGSTDPGPTGATPAGDTRSLPPPPGGTPAQNSAWWDTLSEEAQQDLIDTDPALIGGLDGIPARARDQANQDLLGTERTRLQTELDQLRDAYRAAPTDTPPPEIEHLEAKLAPLDIIHDTLTLDQDDPANRRSLIELDLSKERAEAAIGIGDVDTAHHVAVFTPGFTATVDGSLTGYDVQTEGLLKEMRRQLTDKGLGQTAAAVIWIGYQAPQGLDAASSSAAEQGGAELADFWRGLNTMRDTDPHLTAVLHSYGSTTGGYAAQQDTGIDDIVAAGSPGLGTDNGNDLRTTRGYIHNIEAIDDPVADLGRFGTPPRDLDNVRTLNAEPSTLADGRALARSVWHLQYWVANTTSMHATGAVAVDLPDSIVYPPDPPPNRLRPTDSNYPLHN